MVQIAVSTTLVKPGSFETSDADVPLAVVTDLICLSSKMQIRPFHSKVAGAKIQMCTKVFSIRRTNNHQVCSPVMDLLFIYSFNKYLNNTAL